MTFDDDGPEDDEPCDRWTIAMAAVVALLAFGSLIAWVVARVSKC